MVFLDRHLDAQLTYEFGKGNCSLHCSKDDARSITQMAQLLLEFRGGEKALFEVLLSWEFGLYGIHLLEWCLFRTALLTIGLNRICEHILVSLE